jgi:predicted nucleotidyltransferase
MSSPHEVITERQRHSATLIARMRERLKDRLDPLGEPDLCVYATGSYARGDASKYSDLDVFLVHQQPRFSKVSTVLATAELIRASRDLSLPEFSGNGEYLQVHHLSDMKDKLGSPEDDHKNHFTARLLLLLESTPLYNAIAYDSVITSIVESYFRDYHDHTEGFRPIFLANDIIRFWKTLCLNYEHRRNRPSTDQDAKNKNHLKNLKLKFSRMTTCFSTVITLASQDAIGPKELVGTVKQTPWERIIRVTKTLGDTTAVLDSLQSEYAWFLAQTGRPEKETLLWISDEEERIRAFAHARNYGAAMFKLLSVASAEKDIFRYLIM